MSDILLLLMSNYIFVNVTEGQKHIIAIIKMSDFDLCKLQCHH